MRYVLFLIALVFFLIPITVAAADLSISDANIAFSSKEPFANQRVRIYATVQNHDQADTKAQVRFLIDGAQVGPIQPITVLAYKEATVFIDWTPSEGYYTIGIEVINADPIDGDLSNNKVALSNFLVDLDTDEDLIGNTKDLDDDGDGVDDGVEQINKTNPLVPDTDGDGARDGVDAFPLDPTEQQDSDRDGIGNNADMDDDNDGIDDAHDSAPFDPAIPGTPEKPAPPSSAVQQPAESPPGVASPIKRVQAPSAPPAYEQEPVAYTFPDEAEDHTIGIRIAKSRKSWNTWEFEQLGVSSEAVVLWDFGDQTAGQDPRVTHAFRGPGEYTVTLTVHDATGGVGYAQTDISIGFWDIGNPWVMGMIGLLGVVALALAGMLIFDALPPLRFF